MTAAPDETEPIGVTAVLKHFEDLYGLDSEISGDDMSKIFGEPEPFDAVKEAP